jgi:hypothetical protein
MYLTDVLTRVTITAALTFLLNLVCAGLSKAVFLLCEISSKILGLIAWKILQMTSRSTRRSQMSRAVDIVVQSGASILQRFFTSPFKHKPVW